MAVTLRSRSSPTIPVSYRAGESAILPVPTAIRQRGGRGRKPRKNTNYHARMVVVVQAPHEGRARATAGTNQILLAGRARCQVACEGPCISRSYVSGLLRCRRGFLPPLEGRRRLHTFPVKNVSFMRHLRAERGAGRARSRSFRAQVTGPSTRRRQGAVRRPSTTSPTPHVTSSSTCSLRARTPLACHDVCSLRSRALRSRSVRELELHQ
jgi:hypothetical protein